jgi:hypothetical protein
LANAFDALLALAESSPSARLAPEANGQGQLHLSNGKVIESPSPERELLDKLNLTVLGHYDDGSVEVYSRDRGGVSTVKSVPHLAYPFLLQIAGEVVKEHVYEGKQMAESVDARKKSMAEVRNAIGLEAGAVRLSSAPKLGAGVWRPQEKEIVIVNGGRACSWDGRSLTPILVPRVGSQLLDFTPGEPWCDFQALLAALNVERGAAGAATLAELEGKLSRWPWHYRVDAAVASGLMLATCVQTLLEHRPLGFVTGSSYTGKSLLFNELLEPFFALHFHSGTDVTEAAVRQHVGHSACALIMDEFEKSPHRPKVMELLRASTRGGLVYRGTPNQRGASFRLKHIPWLAATETGLRKEQDRNRCVIMDLSGKWSGPRWDVPKAAVAALGLRCLALAINTVDAAMALYASLRETEVPGALGRVVDSYAVPAAFVAAVRGNSLEAAGRLLRDMIADRFADVQPVYEHEDLLRDILEGLVSLGSGRYVSVNEVITNQFLYNEARDAMERLGVALVRTARGPRGELAGLKQGTALFINISSCKQHLLPRNERWAHDFDIETVLLRLPGARRAQHAIAGARGRGIEIPADAVREASTEIKATPVSGADGLTEGAPDEPDPGAD